MNGRGRKDERIDVEWDGWMKIDGRINMDVKREDSRLGWKEEMKERENNCC